LFSSSNYTNAIDIWSAGVLFAELYLGRHLFEADSDIGQVCAIVKVLGTPTEEKWPVSSLFYGLLPLSYAWERAEKKEVQKKLIFG